MDTQPGSRPDARLMSDAEYKLALAKLSIPAPIAIPEIAGGRDARTLTDAEWRAALRALGIYR